ncbi:MAG: serine/threonine-protein kinase [Acidobacteriota bacterium]
MTRPSDMTSKWPEIERWFDRVLGLSDTEVAEVLRGCPDADVRAEVRSLFQHVGGGARAADALDGGVGELTPDLLENLEEGPDRRGQELGRYRLLEVLGRGGMGVVYLAERADGEYERRVALKLLPQGLDATEARERFLLERQILARLQHPGIAQLLDGGVSPDGFPYLVMELVDGEPLDEFVDARSLELEERLGLFLQVCSAVDFAHRNMVVHRDIKPGNLLVAASAPGGPQVKLLDFGIAKLVDRDEANLTRTGGSQPLTPAYAAPEQLLGEPISAATDVYALGVLLYRLLSGSLPNDWSQGLLSVREIQARAETTQKPSRAVLDLPEGERRSRQLRGDLDNITLTALQLDPARRYPTVQHFAEDVRAFLKNRPVSATANTGLYRARRFVRRNRVGVSVAAGVGALLMAGIALLAHQVRVTEQERKVAENVADFSMGFLELSDVDKIDSAELTPRLMLEQANRRLDESPPADLAVHLRLRQSVATGWGNLNEWVLAARELEKIVALQSDSAQRQARAATLGQLSEAYASFGEKELALAAVHDGLALIDEREDDSELLFELLHARGYVQWLLHAQRAPDEAVQAALDFAAARDGRQRLTPAGSLSEASSLHYLGSMLTVVLDQRVLTRSRARALGLPTSSNATLEEALALRRRLAPGGLDVARSLNDLGLHLDTQGRTAEGLPLIEESVAIYERQLGSENPTTIKMLCNLGAMHRDAGNHARARTAYESHIRRSTRVWPDAPAQRACSLFGLGIVAFNQGDHVTALNALDALLGIETFQGHYRDVASFHRGQILLALGRRTQGERTLLDAYGSLSETLGADSAAMDSWHESTARTYDELGLKEIAASYRARKSGF